MNAATDVTMLESMEAARREAERLLAEYPPDAIKAAEAALRQLVDADFDRACDALAHAVNHAPEQKDFAQAEFDRFGAMVKDDEATGELSLTDMLWVIGSIRDLATRVAKRHAAHLQRQRTRRKVKRQKANGAARRSRRKARK